MARVVRPGGRVACLELSLPRRRTIARLYHACFRHTAPIAARLVRGPRSAYSYLPDSLDGFPAPEQLADAMRSAGLVEVRFARLSGGMVAVHTGTVPAPRAAEGISAKSGGRLSRVRLWPALFGLG